MDIDIRGPLGNSMSLMSNAESWAKQLDWDRAAIDEMLEDMKSGDYNHLLDVIEDKFKYVVTLIGRDEEDY